MMYCNTYNALTRMAGLVAILLLSACSSQPPGNLGVQPDGRLQPCPDRPNCVSSFGSVEDATHYIEPFVADEARWVALPDLITAQSSLRIVEQQQHYIRAEATTRILRFVDDLEFLFRPDQELIHVRSASRVGYSDFGANRERVENIRLQLQP